MEKINRGEKGPKYDFDLTKVLNKFFVKDEYNPKTKVWDGPDLSFDTMLAEQYQKWLKKNSEKIYFSIKEGAHSMYIDCVNNKMGQSSFVDDCEMVEFKIDELSHTSFIHYENEIKEFFSTI